MRDVPMPGPGAGTSVVDVAFAGVNFDDVERRGGVSAVPDLPAVLGVDVVGRRQCDGRRVVALMRHGGGYAQVVVADDAHVVEVPDDIGDEQALGLFEQGATAYGALVLAGRLRAGDAVVVSSAAGGVGHLAVQLAVALGAGPVIGVASTAAKREFVLGLGADHAVGPEDVGARVRALTGGRGADLVVDATGGDTTRMLLRGLAPFGRLVSYGWRAAGPDRGVVGVTTAELVDSSIGCAGFWMRHVVDDRPLLEGIAEELFALARKGALRAHIGLVVPLDRVGDAHAAVEGRASTGKVIIDVRREG
ncbi:quinone oxidoreductase family protein [Actinokineospora sp. 24-640]